ncbi:MAG: c-type cytochrome [Gemmatimonadota bacterium]
MRRSFLTALLIALGASCKGSGPPRTPPPGPVPPGASAPSVAYRVPADSEIPAGELGVSIRRGRALLENTPDSLPKFVGSRLRCTSCHLDAGTRPNASPFVGVYSRFPQYRSRNARINLIQERINDCFERSLSGKALAWDSPEMADMISYMAFLSRGVAPPGDVPGQGFAKIDPLVPDSAAGRLVFAGKCARCHGGKGEGMPNPDPAGTPRYYPPLWGPASFTIGAGMARFRSAAAFIRRTMPYDQPGTLSDREAFDVAGYVTRQSRPDFAGKEHDWPKGDSPPDVAYPTKATARKSAGSP